MHNLTRYCFVPVNGPVILYEYFNCEGLSSHLNLIDEIRPAITWDYFSNGDQASIQLKKWVNEIKDLSTLWDGTSKPTDLSNESGLVGYWRFEEGSGTIVEDLSGEGNHGTLTTDDTGLPAWSTDVPK